MTSLVSVLIPTYNGAAHVAETLRSVLEQTHSALEIIVSDDGSTDETVAVLRDTAGDDPRVTVLAHENVGIFANPVRLLRLAASDLVKFVLQDDLLEPTCIERLVRPLTDDPTITLASSKRRRVDGTGNPLPDIVATTAMAAREGRLRGGAVADHLLETQCNRIGELSTVLLRRSALDIDTLWEVPGWHARGNGDVAVYLKLLAAGDLWYTPDELSSFRTHDTQFGASAGVVIDCIVDWPHLIEGGKHLGFLSDPAAERRALEHWLGTATSVAAQHPSHPAVGELLQLVGDVRGRLEAPTRAGRLAIGVAVVDASGVDIEALARIVDQESPIAECPVTTNVEDAWDEILGAFSKVDGICGVLLLRSDALPTDPGLVERLLERFDDDPTIGLLRDLGLEGLAVARWAAGSVRLGTAFAQL